MKDREIWANKFNHLVMIVGSTDTKVYLQEGSPGFTTVISEPWDKEEFLNNYKYVFGPVPLIIENIKPL